VVGQSFAVTLAASWSEHRVDIGPGVEVSSGPLVTLGVQRRLGTRWAVGLQAATGTLSSDANGVDRDVAQLRLAAAFLATRWLEVEASYLTRTYAAPIARQRWNVLGTGVVLRLPFATTGLTGVGRLALLPVVSVSQQPSPGPAVTAAAGVEYALRRLVLGLFYGVERYDFPAAGGATRHEQLDQLTVRGVWRL
jgi:hypothetical protein